MNVHDVEEVNVNGSLLVYNNNSPKNILFIGSCRTVPIMFYYNSVTKERNVYSILVYKYPTLHNDYIQSILKNTDIIVCENVEHFGIMNTNVDCDTTFFKTFGAEHIQRFYIPNLELRMYHYDVVHTFNVQKSDVYQYFLTSRERMVNRMIKFGYSDLWHEIDRYMYKIRLFSTFSHPTRILSCMLFKHLAKKLGLIVTVDHYREFLNHSFIEGNDSPIFQEDIDTYRFSFECDITNDAKFNESGLHVCAIESRVDPKFFLDTL